MKKLTKVLLIVFTLIAYSCDQDEQIMATQVSVSFGVEHKDFESGRLNATNLPSAIILSIVDHSGVTVFENKKLALIQFGQGYFTESIELATGSYKLTKFLVLNSADQVLYATPLEGSDKASQVNDALPINFNVTVEMTEKIVPQVLSVTPTDTPQSFGYPSFGFEVVTGQAFKVRVKVQFLVGEILYQDVDTKITANGMDSEGNVKWSREFSYVGPNANQLDVNPGYAQYSFEVTHWGITDKVVVTQSDLLNSRADGPSPVTYVLSGATPARKLSSYINYSQKIDPTTDATYFEPDFKVDYQYGANGKLEKMTFSSYSTSTSTFVALRYFKFLYQDNHLARISGYHIDTDALYVETFYSYSTDGNVSDMLEKNYGTGININVHLSYLFPNGIVRAEYRFSNGGSFEYEVSYPFKSVISDRTTKGGGVCSEGIYTNDKNINPFKHLGYVDFLFRDFSINNRLTENVNYTGCGFPTLIPESYSYQYDQFGYPTSSLKVYKPNSAGGQAKSQIKYFYQ